jgi:hypothetical protein
MVPGIIDEVIQKELGKRAREQTVQLATDLLVRKAAKKGFRITPSQKARFRKWMNTGCEGEFSLRIADRPKKEQCEITVTARDMRRLSGRFGALLKEDAEKATSAAIKAAVPQLKSRFEKTWSAHSRYLARLASGFEKRLHSRYKSGFDALSMHLTIAREVGGEVNEEARAAKKRGPHRVLVDVLTRLHARACQIAEEVVVLLRAGFSDGAMARWRSLHEVSVVMQFIAERGPEMAVRYSDHEAMESLKAARGYSLMAERLGHEPCTPAELDEVEARATALLAKYEASYKEDYGWAGVALKKKRPTFADIEKAIGLDHFRPYYKLASHNVHANPKGIFYRLCVLGDCAVLPAGASNVGLTDPAQNTAISIGRATAVVVRLVPHSLDRWCVIAVLNELNGEIADKFWAAEQSIAEDESRLRAEDPRL